MTVEQIHADVRKMKRFICERIPPDRPARIVIGHGRVELSAFWDDDGDCELLIESIGPYAIGLREVYEHFRCQEMTAWEQERELTSEMNRWRLYDFERVMAVSEEGKKIVLSEEKFLSAQDIVNYYQGKISLRLAYQIMDECEPVRAGKKRLVTVESFVQYLQVGKVDEEDHSQAAMPEIVGTNSLPVKPKRGKAKPDLEYEFFRFQH